MKPGFDHSKLRGKIRECGFTIEGLAKKIGIANTTLLAKLNGKVFFTAAEIYSICIELGIDVINEVGCYFFVSKTQ